VWNENNIEADEDILPETEVLKETLIMVYL
jgi:hypothetical protein